MKFITLRLPSEFATYVIESLAYRIESWERTCRAWEDGEQEDLSELEYCDSAAEAEVAIRYVRSIQREIKEQIETSKPDVGIAP